MAAPTLDWQNRATVLLRTELARRGISQRELVERLADVGIKETEKGLSNKLVRGSFSASFLIACFEAIGCRMEWLLEEDEEIRLFDALAAAFPPDEIRRVRSSAEGASGADIVQTVMENGQQCGTIIYEIKNSSRWSDEYVKQLIRYQGAALADYAILVTRAFPPKTAQIEVREGVIIVNPARAEAIAKILRNNLVRVHAAASSRAIG